jgi:hypothetical protein
MSTILARHRWGWVPAVPLPAVLVLVAAPAVGILAGSGQAVAGFGGLVGLVALLVGIRNWRLSLCGLLAYIPISGIPMILMYPATQVPVLLKDILFILPAYVGFLFIHLGRREQVIPRGAPLLLFAGLAIWIGVHVINAARSNVLVGLIGAKVLLMYVPLYILGYHLATSRQRLLGLCGLLAVPALVPSVVGIVEAVLLYSGHQDIVYGWYGPAAAAVTQDFAQLEYGDGASILRVPSTFSFISQFYIYTAAMVAVSYGWWRSGSTVPWHNVARMAIWCTVVLASLLTGARGAFIFIPFMIAMLIVLDARDWRPIRAVILLIGALFTVETVLGGRLSDIIGHTLLVGQGQFEETLIGELQGALESTWIGRGVGTHTLAARYAFTDPRDIVAFLDTWHESWFVKLTLEMGLPGLLLVVLLLVHVVGTSLRNHVRLHDPVLRSISGAFIAVLVWNIAYFPKASYIELDPMNVYFWLFAGLLARIPTLDTPPPARKSLPDGRRRALPAPRGALAALTPRMDDVRSLHATRDGGMHDAAG